tara:strand:+ start:11989 stop:15690 length:3702 start_codon:yes stop_codon:yes gene_type:complete
MKNKFKNTILAGLAGISLSACGGGGGGGPAIDDVNNFVENDLTNLSGSASLVSSYSTLLSDFQSVISSGDISAIQGVITGPDENDIAQANTLLTQLATAQTLWDQTEDLINDQSDADKYSIYNSDSFKEAHAAMLYLQNHVKPIIQKVANGNTITLADYNLVSKADRANEIIQQEKNSTSSDYANTKKIKSVETITNDTSESTDATGNSTVTYSDWTTVYAGGGDETRTKTTSTANIRTTVTTRCSYPKTTFLNNTTSNGAQTCTVLNTTTIDLDPTVTTETETREGDNPVTATVDLEPTVTTTTESSANYTETTYTDADSTTTETDEGSATTNTANRDVTTTTNHGDNTATVTVVRYIDTTVTTPITTRVYRTRHYTDTVKKDTRTITTTTPRQQITYKDGTTEIVNGSATVVTGDWSTTQVSESSRSEKILQSETTSNQVVTTSDSGTQISTQLVSNAYTDNDINLGTVTANMSATVSDHQTAEYNSNHGLGMIKAANAYSRGWTGEGAVLGVIDTWQDTDHEKLDGKYLFYKDYDPYNNTVNEGAQGHGTFVASIVAGKRDGDSLDANGRLTTGNYDQEQYWLNGNQLTRYTLTKNNDMHGVAFNSKLVGANVDRYSSGGISKSQAQNALHDFAKLKSPTADGGEEMNIVAVNMSFNTPQLFYDANGSTVTQLNDGTYNASEIISKIQGNGYGDSQYWKIATDNDIILVNSAGNYGFAHAGDPGIWAVETDSNGNLILGGKMVIVGNWDGSNVSGNKAGHVCLDINTANNTCNDTHRLSDFYILAPGTDITSAISDDRYASGSGTSYAAPHVTGAFGVLNQMWPYMAGDKLVKLVMNTADKNLSGYDVNIHGQGLLDLDEATKPQGAVGLATSGRVDHPTVSLNNTYYSTGTALPSNLNNLKIMVLDDYDRNYYLNIGSSFVVKDKRKMSDVDQLMKGYQYLPINQMYGSFTQGGQYDLGFMNFGLFTGESGNGDYSYNIGKKIFVSDKFAIKGNLGQMKENTTWLGNSSDGILSVGENNITNYGQIGASYQLGNNVLSLDYSNGTTDVNTVDQSLITGFSDVRTESWRLAYEVHKDENNTFGWSFSLPSHITSGTMNMEVAESVNLDGTINYTTIDSNLKQKHKEKNVGFFYNHNPDNITDATFNFSAEYRQDISGVAGNDGVHVGMNYAKKFFGACKFLWKKNPKCYDKNGNLKPEIMALMNGTATQSIDRHGLVYDMKTDKFIQAEK